MGLHLPDPDWATDPNGKQSLYGIDRTQFDRNLAVIQLDTFFRTRGTSFHGTRTRSLGLCIFLSSEEFRFKKLLKRCLLLSLYLLLHFSFFYSRRIKINLRVVDVFLLFS